MAEAEAQEPKVKEDSQLHVNRVMHAMERDAIKHLKAGDYLKAAAVYDGIARMDWGAGPKEFTGMANGLRTAHARAAMSREESGMLQRVVSEHVRETETILRRELGEQRKAVTSVHVPGVSALTDIAIADKAMEPRRVELRGQLATALEKGSRRQARKILGQLISTHPKGSIVREILGAYRRHV